MCSAGRVSSSVIQPRSFLTVQLCLGSCAKRQEEKGGGGEQKLNRGREGWGGDEGAETRERRLAPVGTGTDLAQGKEGSSS